MNLKDVERVIGFIYPSGFLKNRARLSGIFGKKKFKLRFPNASIIDSVESIRSAHNDVLPNNLIPFMAISQIGSIDYYVFDRNAVGENFKTYVFSVHTIVHEWESFENFLDWLEASLAVI